jgi:hypothetical protein
MKKLGFIILSICVLASCRFKTGSGHIISETRNPGLFSGLSVSGGFEVEIKKGASAQVLLEADDNLMGYIETTVSGQQLNIRLRDIHNLRHAHLKVFITAPEINNIKASAGSEVTVMDNLSSTQKIRLQVSSGSNIKTALDAPEVIAESSSGAEMTLSGRTKDLRAESSSGSTIQAKELMSENSYVTSSSGSSASVHASLNLEAKASSGSNITYRGGANVKKTVSSGGEVEKDD